VLAIDEAHILLKRGSVAKEMVRLIRGSRHYGVSCYIATQRLVDVDPDIRAVVSDVFIYRTISYRDRDILEHELGLPISYDISNLSTGSYLYANRNTGEVILWTRTC
jgi:DNA helicase HerA-like ATPase